MPEVLDTQLRAILSVRPHGQCRIMVPMVSSVAEIEAVREKVEALRVELGIAAPVEVGIMMDRGNPAVAAGIDGLQAGRDFAQAGTALTRSRRLAGWNPSPSSLRR